MNGASNDNPVTPDSVVILATMVPGRCGVAMRTLPNPVAAPNAETCTSAVPLPGIEIVVEPAATPLLLNAVSTMPDTVAALLLRISKAVVAIRRFAKEPRRKQRGFLNDRRTGEPGCPEKMRDQSGVRLSSGRHEAIPIAIQVLGVFIPGGAPDQGATSAVVVDSYAARFPSAVIGPTGALLTWYEAPLTA